MLVSTEYINLLSEWHQLPCINYSEIFCDTNGRGTLCPSDIGNKWKANVSVARMNDVHILREMIEIRDGFKECHFCFSRRFILTVTAFTVLFTAWYRPNCIFTYSCYHFKNNNLLVYQLLRLTPALLCCTAPRTARWIWRSINKIIIIIMSHFEQRRCERHNREFNRFF